MEERGRCFCLRREVLLERKFPPKMRDDVDGVLVSSRWAGRVSIASWLS